MEENTQLEEQLKERDYQVNLLKHRLGHVSRSYDNLNNTKMIIVLKKYWKVRKNIQVKLGGKDGWNNTEFIQSIRTNK